ncbi:MAG: hypothetical protein RLP44_14225 [Aggregatilineales bacterium]
MNKILGFLRAQGRKYWAWAIRLFVLWLIVGAVYPVSHRAPLQPPQIVQTRHQQVCVHTDLKDEVDEWKIQRSLQLVREMGATTIVEFFPWAYAESNEDQYRWYQFDRITRHAQNQGIRVIARLGLVPDWARPAETTLNYLPEESFDDFVQFAVDFATRYEGIVDDIIIWNEPNLGFEWGYQEVLPERYVRLLQAVYQPLHDANPNMNVLAGALAPTLEPVGSPHGMNDLIYLEGLYQAGAADYFDTLAVHAYGLEQPQSAEPDEESLNFRRIELVREVMQRYDDEETPIIVTESGWNDNPRWTLAVRPSQRIANTIDAFHWADEHQNWIENLCIWVLRYPRDTGRYPDNWTLITPNFQLKPIYYAIQNYALGQESEGTLWLPPPAS